MIVEDYSIDQTPIQSMGAAASIITISIPNGYSIGSISITKSVNAWCPATVNEIGSNFIRVSSVNLFRDALSGTISIRVIYVKNEFLI